MTLADTLFFFGAWAVIFCVAHAITLLSPFYRREVQIPAPGEIVPLNSLRGLLAFGVFFSHVVISRHFWRSGEWILPESYTTAQLSTIPVLLFFYLSGFLFWAKLIAHADRGTRPAWGSFFRGRVRRMVPAYLLSVAVIVIFTAVHSHFTRFESGPQLAWEIGRWLTFALPDGEFPTLNGDPHSNIMNAAVTWTLRYEWLFLLSLPALAWFAARHRVFALFALIGTTYWFLRRHAFAADIAAGLSTWYVHTSLGFLTYLGSAFGCGIFSAYALVRWSRALAWLTGPGPAVAAILSAILLLTIPFPGPIALTLPAQRVLLLAIFMPVAAGNSLLGLLTLPSLRLLGMVSYSTYLFHGLVLYSASALLSTVQPIGELTDRAYWIFTIGVAVAVVGVSAVIFRYVEHPWMRRGKQAPQKVPHFRSSPSAA